MAGVVGIDVGGTFTDLYYSGDETTRAPHPQGALDAAAIPRSACSTRCAPSALAPDELDAILHGTTIATNAVIERRGAALRAHHDARAFATCSSSAAATGRRCMA